MGILHCTLATRDARRSAAFFAAALGWRPIERPANVPVAAAWLEICPAEWEYAARVGTSNPGFAEKYQDQNSTGPAGFKSPLAVKSKKPNAWGLYDMASCWWEITADKGTYHVRKAVTDPHYPPGLENARSQRTGRGIVSDRWSITTHEFITEKADYAGQKFRVLVEVGGEDGKKQPTIPPPTVRLSSITADLEAGLASS